MNKEMLLNGDSVRFRNNDTGIFIGGFFIGKDAIKIAGLGDYDDDLTHVLERSWDVIEINRPTYETLETRKIVKMTVEEIKEELGYDFEIVEK